MMAKGYSGIHFYKVGEQIKLLNYYQDTKDDEMGTNGCLFGTLITSMAYSVSRTWWDCRVVVGHHVPKGLNDHYWNELDFASAERIWR